MKRFKRVAALLLSMAIAFLFGCVSKTYYTYGATLEFHVFPVNADGERIYGDGSYGNYGKNVMDNMVKLLSGNFLSELIETPAADGGLPDEYKAEKYDENGRQTEEYEALVKELKNSIGYACQYGDSVQTTVLSVTVSVSENDLEFGRALLVCLKTEVAEYVEEMMVLPGDAVATVCELQNPAATILKN